MHKSLLLGKETTADRGKLGFAVNRGFSAIILTWSCTNLRFRKLTSNRKNHQFHTYFTQIVKHKNGRTNTHVRYGDKAWCSIWSRTRLACSGYQCMYHIQCTLYMVHSPLYIVLYFHMVQLNKVCFNTLDFFTIFTNYSG